MSWPEPKTQTLDVSAATQQLDELLDQVKRRAARFVLTQDGRPVAALISAFDLERLDYLLAERAKDFAIIDEIREAFKDVPDEELEREVAKAVEEARQENRRKQAQSAAVVS